MLTPPNIHDDETRAKVQSIGAPSWQADVTCCCGMRVLLEPTRAWDIPRWLQHLYRCNTAYDKAEEIGVLDAIWKKLSADKTASMVKRKRSKGKEPKSKQRSILSYLPGHRDTAPKHTKEVTANGKITYGFLPCRTSLRRM
eukprot:gene8666-2902_t